MPAGAAVRGGRDRKHNGEQRGEAEAPPHRAASRRRAGLVRSQLAPAARLQAVERFRPA